jgi:hypothetical protein
MGSSIVKVHDGSLNLFHVSCNKLEKQETKKISGVIDSMIRSKNAEILQELENPKYEILENICGWSIVF